ncbi:hypothetical protein [Megalodesulfovibrio paquesii]
MSRAWLGACVFFLVIVCSPTRPVWGEALETGGTALAISCSNVQQIRLYSVSRDWTVAILMNAPGAAALREITRQFLNRELRILAGGEEMVREVVHAPLEHGLLVFWEPTREEATRKVERICPERLAPPSAHAIPYPPAHPERVESPTFEIDCGLVASMQLLRDRDFHWRDRSLDGHVYYLAVTLHPDAGRVFGRFVQAQPERRVGEGPGAVTRQHVQLAARGQRICSDLPALDGLDETGAVLSWRTLPAALAAANTICPEKAPITMRVPRTFGMEEVPLPGGE